ncbi:MAG: S41 family peptidase, partial [Bacteroidota bacterium]
LEFRLEDGVGYLRIRSFHPGRIRRAKQKFKPFFRQVFEELAVTEVENLIIDIRNNGGGSESVFMPLLSYLLDESFLVYSELSTNTTSIPDHHLYPFDNPAKLEKYAKRRLTKRGDRYWDLKDPSTKKTEPKQPHFGGKVYVIINEQSYSAAGDFCGVIQQYQRATFVGEETGGNPYLNVAGESLTLVLPHTGIRAEIPILKFVINNDQENTGNGMIPDHRVPITIEDALVYKDPVLPFVKKLIAKQRK